MGFIIIYCISISHFFFITFEFQLLSNLLLFLHRLNRFPIGKNVYSIKPTFVILYVHKIKIEFINEWGMNSKLENYSNVVVKLNTKVILP